VRTSVEEFEETRHYALIRSQIHKASFFNYVYKL
jgi:hypothetical protein